MDQRVDINIGGVTAYRYAVSKGFTGTEEEFAQLMANIGNTQKEIDAAIDEFVNITAPGAVQAVETAQASALEAIGASKTDVLDAVDTSKASAVAAVNSAGDTQKAAVDAEGQRVIGTIPADYTKLSREVDDLRSASYNLIDPTGITPYQSSSDAELTRTGFVIRNTTAAAYSRGYLYLNLKPNTEYTFSAKKHTTSGVAYVGYSEAPGEGEPFPSANIPLISRTAPDDETITKTFTTTTGILVIRFYATWDTAELGEVEYSEIMVFEGTEEKPFARHVFAQDDEARNAINDPQTGLDQKAGILRNTASGAIVSFMPDASVKNLLGLTIAVEPVQAGSGEPSPDNVRPISGWDTVRLVHGEYNQTLTLFSQGTLTGSGQIVGASYGIRSGLIAVESNTTYSIKVNTNANGLKIRAFPYEIGEGNPKASSLETVAIGNVVTIITGVNDKFLRFAVEYVDQSKILIPSDIQSAFITADGNTYSITFPTEAGTVYGGTLEVTTGKLTADRAMVDLGTLMWFKLTESAGVNFFTESLENLIKIASSPEIPQNIICTNYKTVSWNIFTQGEDFCVAQVARQLRIRDSSLSEESGNTFKAAMSGIQLVYKLATPIVYDLAPQQIETIKGQINNVWADTGNETVEFAEDLKTYIDNKFAELQALALENN